MKRITIILSLALIALVSIYFISGMAQNLSNCKNLFRCEVTTGTSAIGTPMCSIRYSLMPVTALSPEGIAHVLITAATYMIVLASVVGVRQISPH
jgi:hypothetical protein